MRPLNQKNRTSGQLKFLASYLLSIGLIASAIIFFVKIPKAELQKSRQVIQDGAEMSKKEMAIHEEIAQQIIAINSHFGNLKKIDIGLEGALNNGQISQIAESTSKYNLEESKLTNALLNYEEAYPEVTSQKELYSALSQNYKDLLSKYQTIRLLRGQQGEMALNSEELEKAQQELEMMKMIQAAGGGGGGGGGANQAQASSGASDAKIAQLNTKVSSLQSENLKLKSAISQIKKATDNIIVVGGKIERIANKIKGLGDQSDKKDLKMYARQCKDDGNTIYKIASKVR